jgi:hypothetical protein
MVAPVNNSVSKKVIKLLPQERDGSYKFNGNFVSTSNAIEKVGQETIFAAYLILLKRVAEKGGLDYLQVFEIDGQRLWFIDDVTHVTALLPEDY